MRQRTKTNGLISHASPNGRAYTGEEERLRKKFEKGDITKEEQYRLASFMAVKKSTKPSVQYTEVLIFGEWSSISKLGLDVNMLVKEGFNLR
jgi:hypothetical protein